MARHCMQVRVCAQDTCDLSLCFFFPVSLFFLSFFLDESKRGNANIPPSFRSGGPKTKRGVNGVHRRDLLFILIVTFSLR